MNISRENTSELSAILTLKIEKADYVEAVDKVLKDYRKKINMPGFRPGKSPLGLVKKQYGTAVMAEEINRIISTSVAEYTEKEELNILGEILPNEEKQAKIDWEKQEDFEFVFDIAWAPQFEVKLDKRKKYPYYLVDITDEMVDRQIKTFAQRHGKNISVETVTDEKDTLRVDISKVGETEVLNQNVSITIDLMKEEAIKAQAMEAKNGTVLTFDPMKVYDNKYEVASMLGISQEELDEVEDGATYTFTVTDVLHFQEAELTEEFFASEENMEHAHVKNLAELRAAVKDSLTKNYQQSSDYKFSIDAKNALAEKIDFNLPEEFLKRWLLETNKEMTHARLDEEFGDILKSFRWQLIRDQIAKDIEVKVEPEDVLEAAIKNTEMQFAQYGMSGMPYEFIANYAQKGLANEETRHQMMSQAFEEKVLSAIKEKVTLEEKTVSEEEFANLFKD